MQITGTFLHGLAAADGSICRAFTLDERRFRHTLELANDSSINKDLLGEPAYYDASIICKRLKVEVIGHLTPEMVLDLEGDDGDVLASAIMSLAQRRDEFRRAQQAAQEAAPGSAEAGSALD